jgi:hypothetical protein
MAKCKFKFTPLAVQRKNLEPGHVTPIPIAVAGSSPSKSKSSELAGLSGLRNPEGHGSSPAHHGPLLAASRSFV